MTQAVVLDIEGTTSSVEQVHQRLFPYSRARVGRWLADRRGMADAVAVLDEVRGVTGHANAGEAEVIARLLAWIDADVKAPVLKYLQGAIWHEGFVSGELRGHVYPDVPSALARWEAAGIGLYTYSSGSTTAQRDWFEHTDHGDLSRYFRGHFDLTSAGPKQDVESYLRISAAIAVPPSATLFITDVVGELDAAVAAGWRACGVRRDDGPAAVDRHRWVPDLAHVDQPGVPAR